jgi:hypothetical protein
VGGGGDEPTPEKCCPYIQERFDLLFEVIFIYFLRLSSILFYFLFF